MNKLEGKHEGRWRKIKYKAANNCWLYLLVGTTLCLVAYGEFKLIYLFRSKVLTPFFKVTVANIAKFFFVCFIPAFVLCGCTYGKFYELESLFRNLPRKWQATSVIFRSNIICASGRLSQSFEGVGREF